MTNLPQSHVDVIVKFCGDLASEVQGSAMLHFEKELRELSGRDVRVYKETMADDSKVRLNMTPEKRMNL